MEAHYDQFIGHYPRAIPLEVCHKLINYFEKSNQINATFDRKTSEDGMPHHVKSDRSLMVNRPYAFIENDPQITLSDGDISARVVNEFLNPVIKNYIETYSILMDLPMMTLYHKIQRTMVGGGYHIWHFEQCGRDNMNRILVYTIYLNDVEEGGETEFLYQHKRYPARSGDVLIFPAHFTHPHRGNPPINCPKYIMTGWVQAKIE